MKIIGIDPGTATTGYGIIKSEKGKLTALEYGCISTSKTLPAAERLAEIHDDLTALIKKYHPEVMVVESLYFATNAKTAIAVAQSRGVILLVGQKHKLKILEFSPLQVKSTLTNYGKADKKQIQQMIKVLLDLDSVPKPDDAADALALAICGSNNTR